MTRSDLLRLVAGRVAVAIVLTLTVACNREPAPAGAADSATPAATDGATGGPLPVLGVVPPFELTDQHGERYGLDDLRGHAWLANFIFTRCRATCPIQTANLAELQSRVAAHPRSPVVRFVSFSVDPTHDTPDVLATYAADHEADPMRWHFLTGPRVTIWSLSQDGFKLAVGENPPDNDNPMFHSPKLILVDGTGRIRGYYDGMDEEGLAAAARDLDRLLKTMPAPIEPRGPHADAIADPQQLAVPETVFAPDWLETRAAAQRAAVTAATMSADFSFTDRQPESGIAFRNRIVDDASRTCKAAHYDHGNGVVAADVDGDGRPDLYFVNQVGPNALYRNLGGGRFEDITEAAGVAVKLPIGVSASFADIDNDGDPDLFVTTVRAGNRLFENDGTGVFRDITEESGLAYSGYSSGATFFDFDRDGLLDLFVSNVGQYTSNLPRSVTNDATTGPDPEIYTFLSAHEDAFAGHVKNERNELSILYRNLGGNRFEDVTEAVQLVDFSWSGDATPIDANEDGWIDLYVLNMQGHDEYYENIGGHYFAKRSREVFPRTPWGSTGVKVFDYDNDGRFDMYISDVRSDMSQDIGPDLETVKSDMQWPESLLRSEGQSIFGNGFYRKTGADEYDEISDAIGAENYWPWGLSAGDLNADGYEDVFLASSMNYPFRYAVNSVLLNDGGRRFVDAAFVVGVEPRRDGRTARPWFTLDCDGDDWGHRHCEDREGTITIWGALGTRSSVILDLDADGDLDIVTNEFNSEPLVLVSNLTERHAPRFLHVDLEGTTSNRNGFGAIVTVVTDRGPLVKLHDGKSGYLSQSDLPLYIGLGDATRVERIDVTWPSGTVQSIEGPIGIGTTVRVREAS